MLDEYHYYIDGEVWGPLDKAQVDRYIIQGRVTADTYVWCPAMAEWARARTEPRLMEAFDMLREQAAAVPPPIPMRVIEEMNQYANFTERVSAMSIDSFIVNLFLGAFYIIAQQVLTFDLSLLAGGSQLQPGVIPGQAAAAAYIGAQVRFYIGFYIFTSIIVSPYYLYFMSELGAGQTPGCRIMKVRLVDQVSRDLVPWSRLVLWYVGVLLIPIGWIFYFADDRRRMLHNMMSGTAMIRSEPRF